MLSGDLPKGSAHLADGWGELLVFDAFPSIGRPGPTINRNDSRREFVAGPVSLEFSLIAPP